ncbi:hypothetical protein TSAR_007117 [Trichomalopsis sarcophagae]|uniref:Uncharacterized protein n=1 Tax=Trichomalopsis sarcophagae TaxID=543379 RepID=A0A232ERK0_9HYME|nr:hypothetical protein TSAR_007117 [Trichomalopsis sarcophagae]
MTTPLNEIEIINKLVNKSSGLGDLVRVIHRNYAVPNEAVQCAIDARSVSESSDEDDEPANSTVTAAAASTNNAQRSAIQNFYSRPIPEAERSYHQIVDRTRMTYHQYNGIDVFGNRINEHVN